VKKTIQTFISFVLLLYYSSIFASDYNAYFAIGKNYITQANAVGEFSYTNYQSKPINHISAGKTISKYLWLSMDYNYLGQYTYFTHPIYLDPNSMLPLFGPLQHHKQTASSYGLALRAGDSISHLNWLHLYISAAYIFHQRTTHSSSEIISTQTKQTIGFEQFGLGASLKLPFNFRLNLDAQHSVASNKSVSYYDYTISLNYYLNLSKTFNRIRQ